MHIAMQNDKSFTLRLPEQEHERIKAVLDQEESVAAFIRKAVREYLKTREGDKDAK